MTVDPESLTERILALPDVAHVLADEASGAPRASWGDRFFFVGPDRRRPFATVVVQDVPGFDEDSRLDREGAFRLNMELGREEFERRFGYPPARFPEHRSGIDFSRPGVLLPHPGYGIQAWACMVCPGPEQIPEVDRLVAHAHGRAYRRYRRALERQPPAGPL